MKTQDILGVLGGLALFLYGMQMMSEGLQMTAGNQLESVLKHLTSHKVKAVLVGMIVTCLIQSSSAMTIMLIGFINAKVMDLKRAAWVVMGANIGTTITGQMIALDIGMIAPVLAIVGVVMIVFLSRHVFQCVGQITAGLGILFMGLEFMAISLSPLQNSPSFFQIMTSLSHPLLSIGVGAVFTAIIQSSSAALGILQTLSAKGLIPFHIGAYMIFGLNIGTCMTALLASLSGCQNAKRLTLFHILFNVCGTVLFVLICQLTPFLSWVMALTPYNNMSQLANLHTFFNIGTTLFFLMIDDYVIRFIEKISSRRLF